MRGKGVETLGAVALIVAMGLIFGIGAARLLAESLYQSTTVFSYWLPSAALAVACAGTLLVACFLAVKFSSRKMTLSITALSSLPLGMIIVYLAQREVNTTQASVLLVGSLALTVALTLSQLPGGGWLDKVGLFAAFSLPLLAYVLTLAPTVGQHDTFEFQVLSYQLGIAHPTGYPLYILLGKLFTLLPIGNVAYRVNLSSALFSACATALLYAITRRLTRDCWASLLAALSFAFSYAFWSQAVEAEVYALNALFVCGVCYLLLRCHPATEASDTHDGPGLRVSPVGLGASFRAALYSKKALLVGAAFLYGLSLTHHRTMLLLAPGMLAYVLVIRAWQLLSRRDLLVIALAFISPLAIVHSYIPLRWWQIHGSPMGWRQFSDLVLGTQFAAALRWGALFADSQRWVITTRTLLDQYPYPALALGCAALVALLFRRPAGGSQPGWREGVLLLLAFGAYLLFGLSYYVPDVSLFLIPSYAVIAVGVGLATSGFRRIVLRLLNHAGERDVRSLRWHLATAATVTVTALLPLSLIWSNLPRVDRSDAYEWYDWGCYALQQNLPTGSVILADSEKMAPLHYLQRVEGLRPDTETGVFPDEDTNRSEIQRRLQEGRPVFLARFLPGLETAYHLRSVGPLVEVSSARLDELPVRVTQLDLAVRDGIVLLGYEMDDLGVESASPVRITLFWRAAEVGTKDYEVRLRLVGPTGHVWIQTRGTTPVNGLYPTGAWRPGEIVADFHQIDLQGQLPSGTYELQAGLFVPFQEQAALTELDDGRFVTVARVRVSAEGGANPLPQHVRRANFADQIMLLGYNFPSFLSPGIGSALTLYWQAIADIGTDHRITLRLVEPGGATVWQTVDPVLHGEKPTSQWRQGELFADTHQVLAPDPSEGPLRLYVGLLNAQSGHLTPVVDGWLARQTEELLLLTATVPQTPTPSAGGDWLPANFENKALLLDYTIHNVQVQRGGALQLSLVWQALGGIDQDYTVFVHLLDENDHIVGQEDTQPAYGTYPTSRWREGELIADP
ncbi:MAG: DUF2723 domain-containing protein, partial [Anaerolineae bacterium]|nr:DUF2723 domain-containing protein [Anaerolineae bacterium]